MQPTAPAVPPNMPSAMSVPAGRPGRAPLIAHLVWEALLLVLCVALLLAVNAKASRSLGLPLVNTLTTTGLQALAVAISLRARQLNLAVTGIAVGASTLVVELVAKDWSLLTASIVAVVVALAFGLLGGLVTGLTRAPAWAVSLAMLALVGMLVVGNGLEPKPLSTAHLPEHPRTYLNLIAAVVVVGSLLGGVLWQVPSIRRALGVDAVSRGEENSARLGPRLLGALVGLGLSSALAALAGVSFVLFANVNYPAGNSGLPLLPIAIVLFGGVSVWGGRGGLAGTLLAAIAVGLVSILLQLYAVDLWAVIYLPAFVCLVIGIGLSAVFGVFERSGSTPTGQLFVDNTGLTASGGPANDSPASGGFGTNAPPWAAPPQPSGYQPSGYQLSGYQPSGYQLSGYQPSGYQLSGYQRSAADDQGDDAATPPIVGTTTP